MSEPRGLERPLLEAHRFLRRGPVSEENWSQLVAKDRNWEKSYRGRWAHDKVVRSTHGVNCTGSCSWNVYVKDGLITWESQAVDYPETGPEMPDYEPRGCPRGASFSWYTYSPLRLKYPYVRGSLLEMFREARERLGDPVDAWAEIVEDPERSRTLQAPARQGRVRARLLGGGGRDGRRCARAHDQAPRPRPLRRLHADPGDVDGVVCGGNPVPVADRRRDPLLLRLVRRPTAFLAAGVRRSDRRARVRRLVQRRLPDRSGARTCRRRGPRTPTS